MLAADAGADRNDRTPQRTVALLAGVPAKPAEAGQLLPEPDGMSSASSSVAAPIVSSCVWSSAVAARSLQSPVESLPISEVVCGIGSVVLVVSSAAEHPVDAGAGRQRRGHPEPAPACYHPTRAGQARWRSLQPLTVGYAWVTRVSICPACAP